MKKLFRKILVSLNATYKKTALKSNGTIFCLLFNFRAILLNKDVRFTFDSSQSIYKAESSRHSRYFFAKEQNWNCYQGGLSKRAQQLGREYYCHLIDFKENDLIIDCGANVGDLELYFQENNFHIRYVGIEPSPREYLCLQKNVKGFQTYNLGLWSEESSLNFFVSSDNADSSFIEPLRYSEVVSVKAKRLDTLISEPVKLLKIEAEGGEPEVLLGCSQLLSNIEYITADLGFERGVLRESTLAPVTNYLLNNGFELFTVGYPRVVALFKRKSNIVR